jgi:hypothetical protein
MTASDPRTPRVAQREKNSEDFLKAAIRRLEREPGGSRGSVGVDSEAVSVDFGVVSGGFGEAA